jgi:anti-sigma factor RsiW
MKQPAINEQLVRRYLLDDLPKRERERVEVGLLTDDRYFEALTTLESEIEDELIDEYLDGELTGTELENFERVFLNSPERAHKLKVIKDLKDHSTPEAEPEAPAQRIVKIDPPYRSWISAIFQNPILGFSTAAALVLALVLCAWLWMKASRLESQLIQARNQPGSGLNEQVEQLNRRNEELTAQLKRSEEQRAAAEQQVAALTGGEGPEVVQPNQNTQPSGSAIATVILTSSLRSNGRPVPTLTLKTGVTVARLVVNVERIDPADYKRFRAVVQKQGGEEVWRSEDVKLRARGNNARAELNIPADKLTEGQYVGALDGITLDDQTEPVGRYVFRVQR